MESLSHIISQLMLLSEENEELSDDLFGFYETFSEEVSLSEDLSIYSDVAQMFWETQMGVYTNSFKKIRLDYTASARRYQEMSDKQEICKLQMM